MHIVIDARELRTTTGRYIERLLHYLQQLDSPHRFTVLLQPKDMAGWEPTNPNFSKLACPYKEFSFSEQFGFALQLYKLRADLVHFGMTQQPLLYFKKSVTSILDLTTVRFRNPSKNRYLFWLKQQVYKVVILYAARKSKHVLTLSRYVATDLMSYTKIPDQKISVTYLAADKIIDSPTPLPYLQNKKFIMYVGRPLPHKNLARLIAAFQLLQPTNPDLYLVLAGRKDAVYSQIEADCEQRGLQHIIFTDFITDGELRWLYEHTAVYVFPSLSEGFGLPGLEVMQYGTPLASSNATCLPEIYGDAAVYFDPLDIADMAAHIEQLLTDPALRTKTVAAEAARLKKYSWQRTAEQTLAVYNSVL